MYHSYYNCSLNYENVYALNECMTKDLIKELYNNRNKESYAVVRLTAYENGYDYITEVCSTKIHYVSHPDGYVWNFKPLKYILKILISHKRSTFCNCDEYHACPVCTVF